MISKFTEIGIPEDIAKAMDDMGWEEPTPIQINAIPMGLEGYDMFAQAQTGTGKTGAYGSIVLGSIKSGNKVPSAIVLVPTRELANQVAALVGVGRGADLMLYLLLLAVYAGALLILAKFRRLEHQITELTRKIALYEAEKKE